MSNRFYFSDNDDSTSQLSSSHNPERDYFNPTNNYNDDDDNTPLPFPKPIDRTSFNTPNFDATIFLSSLTNRFQTLEDLQEELRDLSQSLNKELVDLVNDNYQDFLNLGGTLSGGEERIEEIRVGLLSFQREVTTLRDRIESRKQVVRDLVAQKRELRREIGRGRVLLEIAERLDELEDQLRIVSGTSTTKLKGNGIVMINKASIAAKIQLGGNDDGVQWGDEWDEGFGEQEIDNEVDEKTGIPTRLSGVVEQYRILRFLMRKHDSQHPFLVSQRERIAKVRDTVRIDLEAAISQEEDGKVKRNLVQLYSLLDDT